MELDYVVLIGHFAPFHNGHLAIARAGLAKAKKLLALAGTAGAPRTPRNPWTLDEQAAMIRRALPEAGERLIVCPLQDHLYNESRWIAGVQQAVGGAIRADGGESGATIGIIGMQQDPAGKTLAAFQHWTRIEVPRAESMTAGELRRHLFDAGHLRAHSGMLLVRAHVPPPVFDAIEAFRTSAPEFAPLLEEYRFVERYRGAWSEAPYAPTFVTADAVVVHSGHVLLVRRGAQPGRGLWALPGGFVGQQETIFEACLRELREETGLKVPLAAFDEALRSGHVFDRPDRSARGRTITHVFHFEFPVGELPAVSGGDDADQARWLTLGEAARMRDRMFEDHFHILEYFLGMD